MRNDPECGARWRETGPWRNYRGRGCGVCLAIGLALVWRHGCVDPYEGAVALAGVFGAWFGGLLWGCGLGD